MVELQKIYWLALILDHFGCLEYGFTEGGPGLSKFLKSARTDITIFSHKDQVDVAKEMLGYGPDVIENELNISKEAAVYVSKLTPAKFVDHFDLIRTKQLWMDDYEAFWAVRSVSYDAWAAIAEIQDQFAAPNYWVRQSGLSDFVLQFRSVPNWKDYDLAKHCILVCEGAMPPPLTGARTKLTDWPAGFWHTPVPDYEGWSLERWRNELLEAAAEHTEHWADSLGRMVDREFEVFGWSRRRHRFYGLLNLFSNIQQEKVLGGTDVSRGLMTPHDRSRLTILRVVASARPVVLAIDEIAARTGEFDKEMKSPTVAKARRQMLSEVPPIISPGTDGKGTILLPAGLDELRKAGYDDRGDKLAVSPKSV